MSPLSRGLCSVVAVVTARHRSPLRYPLVELACAALFAGTAARFGRAWDLPAYPVLFAGLLALSCIDVERLILPKKIVYPLTILVAALLILAAAETGRWHDYVIGIICAVGVVRRILRDESCQSAAVGFRGRAAFVGARSLVGMAGRWLCPARLFRSESHRRDRWYHPDRHKAVWSGRAGFHTGFFWPQVAPSRCSPVLSSSGHSRTPQSEGLADGVVRASACPNERVLHPQALLVPLRVNRVCGWPPWQRSFSRSTGSPPRREGATGWHREPRRQ